jgi:hypothetical protein
MTKKLTTLKATIFIFPASYGTTLTVLHEPYPPQYFRHFLYEKNSFFQYK